MNYLAIMMNMKKNLETISYEHSTYIDLVKMTYLLIQDVKNLEAENRLQKSITEPEPIVMALTNKEVTIALWRNGWIYHVLKGHDVSISRCGINPEDVENWNLDGPPADDGYTYFIKVGSHIAHDSAIWISKDEADILRKALIKAYSEYYDSALNDPAELINPDV